MGTGADTSDTLTKMYWAQLGPFRRLIAVSRTVVGGSSGLYFLHHDHLGSTKAISGTSGGPMKYYPFGSTYQEVQNPPTDIFYTGQKRDLSTGLYFYGARYLNPEIGMFTQPDSIVPNPGNPQSLNRYGYALNNPLKYTDPTGHWSETDPDIQATLPTPDPVPPVPPVEPGVFMAAAAPRQIHGNRGTRVNAHDPAGRSTPRRSCYFGEDGGISDGVGSMIAGADALAGGAGQLESDRPGSRSLPRSLVGVGRVGSVAGKVTIGSAVGWEALQDAPYVQSGQMGANQATRRVAAVAVGTLAASATAEVATTIAVMGIAALGVATAPVWVPVAVGVVAFGAVGYGATVALEAAFDRYPETYGRR